MNRSPKWPPHHASVNRLGCLRGIAALTGLALTVEIGDWSRFTGSSIGAYVGLVPCEYSTGTSRVQGSITKAGNTHVRRLLFMIATASKSREQIKTEARQAFQRFQQAGRAHQR
jgi:transposase